MYSYGLSFNSVVDVPIQLLHQFLTALSRVHIQEHQRYLPFRREVLSASPPRSHALPGQSKVLRHLMQGQLLLDHSKLAFLKCLSVQIIKIILRKRKSGGYSRDILYLSHAD